MSASEFRHRPIYGGVFGMGRYSLATAPCVVKGLHAVRFMVIEPSSGAVLSLADDKVAALDSARRSIQANEAIETQRRDHGTVDARQATLWTFDDTPLRPIVDRRRPISKRRRDIFSKSGGRCHYCAGPLQLDGHWHVEHMLPRALGGADEICNLVAACAPCNLAKRDQTAVEFLLLRDIDEA